MLGREVGTDGLREHFNQLVSIENAIARRRDAIVAEQLAQQTEREEAIDALRAQVSASRERMQGD